MMVFDTQKTPNLDEVLASLGYRGEQPDETTQRDLESLGQALVAASRPRWCYTGFAYDGASLQPAGFVLAGKDIGRHLEKCTRAVLLGVTLGPDVDALVRTSSATDMRNAVLLDALASELIEQYADAAEDALRADAEKTGYLTGRFSPGYGDFPLESQRELVRLLDAPRAIGLTVGEGGMLLPTKSITAVLGWARVPVKGRLAGCATCVLNGNCKRQKEGNICGKTNV